MDMLSEKGILVLFFLAAFILIGSVYFTRAWLRWIFSLDKIIKLLEEIKQNTGKS